MTLKSILVSDDTVTTQAVAVADDNSRESTRDNQTNIDFKMVTFSLSGKDYSIDIMNVKEIAKAGNFTYVPNTLPFVIGVYNLRGEIIPILDMRLFFNIQVSAQRSASSLENLLILHVADQTFGIVVDKIDKVVGVQKSHIQPPHPLFGDINVKYILGVVENDKRLYILLDIERIFSKETLELSTLREEISVVSTGTATTKISTVATEPKMVAEPVPEQTSNTPEQPTKPAEPAKKVVDTREQDYKFIAEGLHTLKNFVVSKVNEEWVKSRFDDWAASHEGGKNQLQNEKDAAEYLKPFWSKFSDKWWSSEYADAIRAALPDNAARQIVVWNPGCGSGIETYCLACVLLKRYPAAKIKVYAQDIDLLSVSNASMLTVPESEAGGWLAPFLSKNASGNAVFSKQVKDSVMFEYHDCRHTNALPMSDIIFARDLISLFVEEAQRSIITDFEEKIKGNGVLIIGDNERIPDSFDFIEHTVGMITTYKKQ